MQFKRLKTVFLFGLFWLLAGVSAMSVASEKEVAKILQMDTAPEVWCLRW